MLRMIRAATTCNFELFVCYATLVSARVITVSTTNTVFTMWLPFAKANGDLGIQELCW
jgi:hypothetical protein